MKWIRLKDKYPDSKKHTLVIGADIWSHDRRMHICEVEKKKSDCLAVLGSICPDIGGMSDAFWAPIPSDDSKEWIKYDHETYTRKSDYSYAEEDEVIIRLFNGNKYVGNLEHSFWCPSFNQMRYGDIENVSHYMPLPPYPQEISDRRKDK